MKAALYCPDCKTEFLVADYRPPTHCGLCHIKWSRRVELVLDPGSGDVSADKPTEPHIEVPRG